MGEEGDAISSSWGRAIVLAALISGGSSGASFITADTTDRYHSSTAKADLAIRDRRIADLESAYHKHIEHSAKYTQIIKDLKQRLMEHARTHQ